VNDQNKVEYRPVRLGIHVDTMRVVAQGASTSDWVVVNGLQRARPGAVVTPERAEMATPSADKAEPARKEQPAEKTEEKSRAKAAATSPPDDKKATAPPKSQTEDKTKGAPAKTDTSDVKK
jgi:multidrug efflux system membrane fusion protein